MHTTVVHSLAGAALLLTLTGTILDGVCYVWSNRSSFESAIVSLSAVSCVDLVLLLVLRQIHPKGGTWPWRSWQSIAHCLLVAYLFLAAGTTAGLIAKSSTKVPAEAQLITRNVFWALSVFLQALFSGYLLVSNNTRKRDGSHRWPCPLSHELEALQNHSSGTNQIQDHTDSPSIIVGSCRPSLSINPKASTDGLAPVHPYMSNVATRVSSRYSGKTLFQQESKHDSIDLHSGVTSSSNEVDALEGDTGNMTGPEHESTSTRPAPQRKESEDICSVDSLLILPSPPSPTESATPESSINKQPILPKLNFPPSDKNVKEENIHPLFRSDSPSPSPTPMPGTMVKASPVAGTTISAMTLSRVRSSNSLRMSNGGRSRSPMLLERMSEGRSRDDSQVEPSPPSSAPASSSSPISGAIMAGGVRRSMVQYEKKYELNESVAS